jgi:hypothetical protein
MYIRALLVKARLIALKAHENLIKAEDMVEALTNALSYVKKALLIIDKNKAKYAFLVYNSSVCVYNIIRSMIKPNWMKFFVDLVEQIDKLFKTPEVNEPDYNWRCRYSWLLY